MRYVWDPAKDALNQRKHGLSLADGQGALEDPLREFWSDDRFDYGEERIITLGRGSAAILVVVSTERCAPESNEDETVIRIISVRKAVKVEQDWYRFGKP
jgi:uncharacterized DUF497 family protein